MKNELIGLKKQLEQLRDNKAGFIAAVADDVAQCILAGVKLKTPVKTGLLRRSWLVKVKKQSDTSSLCILENNVEYAPYVEYGHRAGKNNSKFVEGKHMAQRTIEEVASDMPEIASDRFNEFIKGNS